MVVEDGKVKDKWGLTEVRAEVEAKMRARQGASFDSLYPAFEDL